MKIAFFLLLFLLSACTHWMRTPASFDEEKIQHIVFDIDWTIVSEIKEPSSISLNSSRVIPIDGHHYFINLGLEEFIQQLASYPDVRISFFSGGKRARNQKLLEAIKLKDGRSLFSLAHKVFGFEDLIIMNDVGTGEKFSKRYKKDLTKISETLDNVLMFDDTPEFTLPGKGNQQEQVFFIGSSYLPFDQFEEAQKHSGEFIPASKESWQLDRNRLVILNEAFKEAYKEWQNDSFNTTLAMHFKRKESLLNFPEHKWTVYSRRLFKQSQKSKTSGSRCLDFMQVFFKAKAIQ